jgi:hypothetical protein
MKALCIKSYFDEDDFNAYKEGELEPDKVKIIKKGEVYDVTENYSKEHFVPLENSFNEYRKFLHNSMIKEIENLIDDILKSSFPYPTIVKKLNELISKLKNKITF